MKKMLKPVMAIGLVALLSLSMFSFAQAEPQLAEKNVVAIESNEFAKVFTAGANNGWIIAWTSGAGSAIGGWDPATN